MSNKAKPTKPPVERRAFSVDEFAERWGMVRSAVYDLMAKGELQSVKIGRRRVITLEQEERFRIRKEAEAAQ